MPQMLLTPASYVAVIALGFALKRLGFFGEGDHRLLSKIMLNVTLPCAVVVAFEDFSRDASLFFIVGIGLAASMLPILAMYALSRRAPKGLCAYRMLNAGGANIGCFAMPLIQGIFGGAAAAVVSLYDTGNAIVMTGGSYAVTSSLLQTGGRRESAREIARKFVTSVPFDAYMLMLLLTALGGRVPAWAAQLLRPAAQANGFVAMLTIGVLFEPVMDRALLGETARVLAFRFACSALFASACFFLTPYNFEVRRVLVLLSFAPISSLAPVYTERCGGDAALAGFTNSVSIAASLAVMLALAVVLG